MKYPYRRHAQKYINLFADCKMVRGYTRALLIDLSRKRIFPIPLSYFELSLHFRDKKISEIKTLLADKASEERFYRFIDFLLMEKLGVLVDDISLFPDLKQQWDHASPITNAIIDIRNKHEYLVKAINELSQLRCMYLQIRFYKETNLNLVRNLAKLIKGKCFRNVQVLLKYNRVLTNSILKKLTETQPNLHFIIHSVPVASQIVGQDNISYTRQVINSCNSCGIIDKYALSIPSIQGYMENKLFNSCLNRKISVDENGNICNCPSMKSKYGNIMAVKLTEVVGRKHFRKVWSINKDMIDTCRDCEFRYICSDCRAYTENGTLMSKPAKCGYNPYTGVWKVDSGHRRNVWS